MLSESAQHVGIVSVLGIFAAGIFIGLSLGAPEAAFQWVPWILASVALIVGDIARLFINHRRLSRPPAEIGGAELQRHIDRVRASGLRVFTVGGVYLTAQCEQETARSARALLEANLVVSDGRGVNPAAFDEMLDEPTRRRELIRRMNRKGLAQR